MITADTFDLAQPLSRAALAMKASAIREILKITQRPDIISFAGGLPAPELFPLEQVRQAVDAALTRYGPASLQYSTTEGHPPLREWIAERDGVPASNVQIVTGSQQGLDLLGKILIDPGDLVLVEAPTYLGALQSFTPYLPTYMQVPTDEDGIDVDALETQLGSTRAKLLYAIPNFQNPTGRTLSLERRRRLVELTAHHGIVLIEDDPYGALRFSGKPLPSLYAIGLELAGGDPDRNHVVYCSSFSKTLVPGLRDAWVIAARPLLGKLVQAKQGADLHTPTLNQMIITELLPIVDAQAERVRGVYGERASRMMARMDELLPGSVTHTVPTGGMFLWCSLPQTIDTTPLLEKAVARKVAYVPGDPFFALGGGAHTMRLSYSNATFEQIDQGVEALAQTLHEALDSPSR